jgi:CRP/FNR family transcriptional regulator, anaerobic regulatory protein
MKTINQCISEHIQIEESILNEIVSHFTRKKILKGEFLLKQGTICRELFFIESGYFRMYDIVDGKEITLWIAGAGNFITSLSSFVFESVNHWNIQAIEDSSIMAINRRDHFHLSEIQRKWLEFDNLLLARSFALLEQNMFAQLHTTAQQRFETLMIDNPAIFNHVPLQYIASMLGITPETLSRLRKNSNSKTS